MYHVQDFDILIATFKAIAVFPGINSRSDNPPPPKRCPPHRSEMYICNMKQVPLVNKLSLPLRAGDTLDFKWWGWSNGGKNQNPKKSLGLPTKPTKKSLDQKLTPKKSHAKFLSLKNLQKALNDITQKIWTIEIECLCLFINHTIWIYRLFWIPPKIPYLNQATQEKMLAKFFYPKKSQRLKCQTQKFLWSSPSLEIWSTTPSPLIS